MGCSLLYGVIIMATLSGLLPSGGGTEKFQEFTSAGTWTHPNPGNVIHLFWRACGGGAGGGNDTGGTVTFSGSGAEIREGLLAVTGDVIVAPGAGGSGVPSGNNTTKGNVGGDTEIDGVPVALGGGRYLDSASSSGTLSSDPGVGGGSYVNSNNVPASTYGSIPGGASNSASDAFVRNTPFAIAGADDGKGKGGGASLGDGGDGNETAGVAASDGAKGGGGGSSANDGGGGNGGPGCVQFFWRE